VLLVGYYREIYSNTWKPLVHCVVKDMLDGTWRRTCILNENPRKKTFSRDRDMAKEDENTLIR
jgi:hypothetical protein